MACWVYDIVLEIATDKVIATVFHPHDNSEYLHSACAQHVTDKLRLEGNELRLSKQFNTLKEAQAHWYKETKQADMIKGLD